MSRAINAAGALVGLALMTAGIWGAFGPAAAAIALGAALFGLGLAGLR